jgi:hypothetical protein
MFYVLAEDLQGEIAAQTADPTRDSVMRELTDALGGDDLARIEAERLVTLEEQRAFDDVGADVMAPEEPIP